MTEIPMPKPIKTKTITIGDLKEFIRDLPNDYEVYFAVGLALYGINQWKEGWYNRRIIFRE